MGAHWRHLVNTIEQSMCGSNVALRQTTLTTCSAVLLQTLQQVQICRQQCCRLRLFCLVSNLRFSLSQLQQLPEWIAVYLVDF